MFTQQPVWGESYLVSATMTGDDLIRLPDDGRKNELYEGVLVKDDMIVPAHGIICQRLGGMLGMYAIQHQFMNTILQNALFDFTPPGAVHRTVLAPDISIMHGPIVPATSVTTDIPLIAIEVLSPSQTMQEMATKAQFYRNARVDEVWLIAPSLRVVEIWHAQGQTLLNDSQLLTSNLLPGFSAAIKQVLDG